MSLFLDLESLRSLALELRGQARAGALDLSLENVMAKTVLFLSPSGHVGSPYFHCPEGVPAPGKDGTHCPHCHHLRREARCGTSLHPRPSESSD